MLKSLSLLIALLFSTPLMAQTSNAGMTPCGNGITLSVTGTTSNSQLSACGSAAIIWNIGATEAFLNLGSASNTAATTSGWSIPAGGAIVLNTGRAPLYIAAITASSTTTIRVVQGNGDPGVSTSGAATGASSNVVITGPLGQALMAASVPVVIASNQSAVPVSGTFFQTTQPISIASGMVASGAYASGAFASGSVASGAFASGSIASGAIVDLGAQADSACATDNGTCSEIALIKRTNQRLTTLLTGPLPVTLPTTGTIAAGNSAVPTTSSEAGAATTAASGTAAASNLVLKSGAGNLYDLTVTVGATSGYVMLFDATALPSNGAVTPVWCGVVTSNGTNGGISAAWPSPKRFGTGITAGFSTTGCFTLTASATANFFGDYK